MIHGVINIYKEKGYTSHDIVAKLRGILRQKKIGHTGTLDPDAEGVLPVCLGGGTRLCDMLTDKDKTYRAVMLLGKDRYPGYFGNRSERNVGDGDRRTGKSSSREFYRGLRTDPAHVFCTESERKKIVRACQRRKDH